MKRQRRRGLFQPQTFRTITMVLVPILLLTSCPFGVWATPNPRAASPTTTYQPLAKVPPAGAAARNVVTHRTVPKVKAPAPLPSFSSFPTDAEISHAWVFDFPLVPIGHQTSLRENKILALALLAYLQRRDGEDMSALLVFLRQ